MKNNKKGFTLVELLVVIAILAILATVSIVGYTSFINNANNSVAQQELTQIRDYYLAGKYLTPPVVVSDELRSDLGLDGTLEEGTVNGKTCYKYTSKGTAYWFADTNEVTVSVTGWVAGESETPAEFPWKGSSVVFVGDSITAGSGTTKIYHQYLADKNEFSSVTPMGVGGSCISAKSDYGTGNSPLINRWQNIPNADLIVIFMGTNDFGHQTPLGNVTDTTDVSFYGALNAIVAGIQKQHPNSQLVFMTPLHRYYHTTSGMNSPDDSLPNKAGYALIDYVNAIKTVCANNEIPVIDLYNLCTLDPKDQNYFPDKLHPNADGHAVIAELVYEALYNIPKKEIDNSEEEIVDPTLLQYGNKFATGEHNTALNRVSAVLNMYLEEGDTINIKSGYTFAVYKTVNQNTSTGTNGTGWAHTSANPYRIPETGYYGITIKKNSEGNFALGNSDSDNLYDYISIGKSTVILTYGNKFASGYNQPNRASSTVNLYLTKGTVIAIKDNAKYDWDLGRTDNRTSSNLIGEFYPDSSWTKKESCVIPEDGWYGFVLLKADNTNFDFEGGSDSKNLWDYFSISVPVAYGNKLTSGMTEDTNRLSAKVYLEAGTKITFKAGTDAGWWALGKDQPVSSGPVWETAGGWVTTSTYTIEEAGVYYILFKEQNNVAFADPTTFDLFDFVELSGYPQ